MKYITIFVIALFLLSSCSEDSTTSSTNDGKPYLEVSPGSINVAQYESFGLKYRVANFPYDGQIMQAIDFGNGDSTTVPFLLGSAFSYQYKEPGSFTIKLSAYDSFADTLLATKSVPVTVTPLQPTISISPANLDTAFIEPAYSVITFTTSSNIDSYPYSRYTWTVTGNGVNHSTPDYAEFFSYNFSKVGTFTVTVRVKDYTTQKELVVHSTTVTIRKK